MSCTKLLLGIAGICIFGISALMLLQNRYHQARNNEPITLTTPTVKVAPGVVYHYFLEGSDLLQGSHSDALVVDVQLNLAAFNINIVADNPIRRKNGKIFGPARTVSSWCSLRNALAGINGGFFGETDGEYKQIEGPFCQDGKVYNGGAWLQSKKHIGEQFVRSIFAVDRNGVPVITWGTVHSDTRLEVFDNPTIRIPSKTVSVSSAVGCGPRLIANGLVRITDAEERLVSKSPRARTYVAYDMSTEKNKRRPSHFVMGIAMDMTYTDIARFLTRYYRNNYSSVCAEAMCLDGGSSSQLVFRLPHGGLSRRSTKNEYLDTRPSLVSVPTAILLVPKNSLTTQRP